MSPDLAGAIAAVDLANAEDPSSFEGQALALAEGRKASVWLGSLCSPASAALHLAVRAHHLQRWHLQRSDYPTGRAGYLRWRRDNKTHQAQAACDIAVRHGFDGAATDRLAALLRREGLRDGDPETQLLEDCACLVFLETRFVSMVEQTEHDKMLNIVVKTLAKMSPAAHELAATINLTPEAADLLSEAIAEVSAS